MTKSREEILDDTFGTLDDWLCNGDFDLCSAFLDGSDVDELGTAVLLTILTATLPAKKKLPGRAAFFRRVRSTLQRRCGDAKSLLTGLK